MTWNKPFFGAVVILNVSLVVAALVVITLLLQGGSTALAPTVTASPTPTNTATVTPTETPTVTPIPPTETPMPTRVRVTWYGEAFRGGPVYCGTDVYGRYDPDDPSTVAMGADGPPYGSRLRLCSESTCITATIKDKCGGCGSGHLDLSRGGWEALGRPESVLMTILEVHVHPTIAAPVGGSLPSLPLPSNTRTVTGGCASDGTCYGFNFYWAPTHEVVLADYGENNSNQEVHEQCHAHQHWTINRGLPLSPADYDLESWYGTSEGQSFMAAVAGLSFPWTLSAENGLEDFAWTCANWYRDPARLLQVGGLVRYEWAKENLP